MAKSQQSTLGYGESRFSNNSGDTSTAVYHMSSALDCTSPERGEMVHSTFVGGVEDWGRFLSFLGMTVYTSSWLENKCLGQDSAAGFLTGLKHYYPLALWARGVLRPYVE